MRFSRSTAATAAAVALPLAAAQTFTSCNPLNSTCPKDVGLNAASFTTNFADGQNSSWTAASGTTISYGSNGAEFTIAQAGQAPTIYTDFYFFFGRVDITMRCSPGTGIISSIVLLSDDLDEIDWEFIGGNSTTVETNFFGKGNTTLYDRAIYYPVDDPQNNFHTYSIIWTSEQLEWLIDDVSVRVLPYDSPLANNGEDYPQTPMQLKLGNWAAGGPGEPEGTVSWAGGSTNFGDAPFNMYVQSVSITNYNPAAAYEYEGNSGSWQDIKLVNGGSTSSATGGAGLTTSSAATTNTVAPTSSIKGNGGVSNTQVAVSTTKTGTVATTSATAMSTSNTATSSTTTSAPTNAAQANVALTGGSLLSVLMACLLL